ncbi:hypothetical protein ANCDUO_22056 [Ancylostoma duodenale]|uniref:Uncharacterized protein n=1 Tax=Ancylostoma duodenale TaxID=51022 RepID=A0A0C2FMI8_9BILA|nr:hypothetical protein ANCDUO_22056 [Ancylostoma duodenale]
MAPRKQSQESEPAWLQPILKRWDDYFNRFDKIFEIFIKMQDTQAMILAKLSTLEERCNANFEVCPPTNSAIYSTLVKFQTDAKIVSAKSCRVTWVGIGEREDDASTRAFDREAVREVVETSGDQELLKELNSGKIDFHRHPAVRSRLPNARPRIIKITLRNQELRDRLLQHMRTGRQSLTRQYVHSYARPDYTREEIDYDRALRKKAGVMNETEGKLMYVVRDLAIHKLRVPRDLPSRHSINASHVIERSSLMDNLALPTLHTPPQTSH